MTDLITPEIQRIINDRFNGGGIFLANSFVYQVSTFGRHFPNCLEMCAGPGYIGRSILANKLCTKLILSDINQEALDHGRTLYEENPSISYYQSDNLKSIPKTQKFDLVVGNPPNYYDVQKNHYVGKALQVDLRPNDRGRKIHKEFYSTIRPFLNPGAMVLIQEIAPFKSEVFIGDNINPYDIRPRIPLIDFSEMIQESGLRFLGVIPYLIRGNMDTYFFLSTNL